MVVETIKPFMARTVWHVQHLLAQKWVILHRVELVWAGIEQNEVIVHGKKKMAWTNHP